MADCKHFNPRSPHGERRWVFVDKVLPLNNFNPRSPHGERLLFRALRRAHIVISTHAPRTGSDLLSGREALLDLISTHAPRTGSDSQRLWKEYTTCNFNPRSPHGERRRGCADAGTDSPPISTHAPRTGSDSMWTKTATSERRFQPTLPARGATCYQVCEQV